MIDNRTQVLITSVRKLLRRGAEPNIRRILSKAHEADVAVLLESFDISERVQLFYLEEEEQKRASSLSYLSQDSQRELLEHLPKDEILKMLSLMDSDDAADLLGYLSEEESKDILLSMVKEDSEEVADLMGYPEDSAGGLMSSEYLSLDKDLTVAEAIQEIQHEDNESKVAFYIYVTNEQGLLIGIVSLKQLLLSKKSKLLKDIMTPEVISTTMDAHQEQVAEIVERYDFLSLPVVDAQRKLIGVITVDDVLDVIREEAEEDLLQMGQAGGSIHLPFKEHLKARFPWIVLAFASGALCFSVVYLFGDPPISSFWLIAAFTPMLLSLGATVGGQSTTVALGVIRSTKSDMIRWGFHLQRESQLGFVFATTLSAVIWLMGEQLFPQHDLSHIVALATFFQITLSMVMGHFIPMIFHRLQMETTMALLPLLTMLADLSAVGILFGFFKVFKRVC